MVGFVRGLAFRFVFAVAALLCVLPVAGVLAKGDVPKQPILRFDAGSHTAVVSRLSADGQGRVLATASDDKTVRLWSVPDGRKIKVLRPPIGPNEEGQIYAVAVSPDGSLVAAGGVTGVFWDGRVSVYVFDAQTGDIVQRLTGLGGQVQHLAFSPDGKRLAAALGLRAGIKVWNVAGWNVAAEDADYGGPSYSLAFDREGRLATTSDDGHVRLYDAAGKQTARVRASGQPDGVAFSPDGTLLAVGYADAPKVEVLSATDLSPRFSPDVRSLRAGNLGRVAWSTDGRSLFAAGRVTDAKGRNTIRRWSDAGKGAPVDMDAARDAITALLPVPGGVAFAASDASFGILGEDGRPLLTRSPALADFRDMGAAFRVSKDGGVVRFGLESFGKRPITFDLGARKLVFSAKEGRALTPPETASLPVLGWKNTPEPKLSGRALGLDPDEISRSLAIAPGAGRFVLGTDWYLRAIDSRGQPLWKTPVPATAWAVNISGDGAKAVAALGDGTIRWYRMSDGYQILSLFPMGDGVRWVAWTPSGYYDAGAGGDTLIGWHVNNGKDAPASFFPVSHFSEVFYRKDVVAQVLGVLDEQKTLEQVGAVASRNLDRASMIQGLPPEVKILSPRNGSQTSVPTVVLSYAVTSKSPIRDLRVRIDGRAPASVKGDIPTGKTEAKGSLEVAVPSRSAEIALIAVDQDGRESEPEAIQIQWAGAAKGTTKPNLYALVVGVSDYKNPNMNLGAAAKDSRDFAALLKTQEGKLYKTVDIKLLTDSAVTRKSIIDSFYWMEESMTGDDVGVIFFAGHGTTDDTHRYTFVTPAVLSGAGGANDLKRNLRSEGLRFGDVLDAIRGFKGSTYLFIDTCHSGDVLGAEAADVNKLVNDLSRKGIGLTVFASSQGNESSIEDDKLGNGLFTWAIKDGLSAGKDNADADRDGRVSVEEIAGFVTTRVRKRSMEMLKGEESDQKSQTPAVMPLPETMTPEHRSQPMAIVKG